MQPYRDRFRTLTRFSWGALGATLAFVLVLGAPEAAYAQEYFTLDRAQPSGAPDDGFMVFRPHMGKETRFYANALLGFSLNPLREDAVTQSSSVRRQINDPIQGQFPLYLSGGVEILGRFGFNMMLPAYVYQFTGSDPNQYGVGRGGIADAHAGLGDLRLDARGIAYQSQDKRTSIGGTFAFTVPTGTENTFGGDTGWTATLLLAAEHDFGAFILTGHIGPHFKPSMSIGGTNGDLVIGNELRYAFGAFVPLRDDRLRLGVELWGSTSIEDRGGSPFLGQRNTTLEWLAQGRMTLDPKKRFYANAGLGTRLSAGYGSADFRILGGVGMYWTLEDIEPNSPPPRVKVIESKPEYYDVDSDGDGYPDAIDLCPDVKEDGKPPHSSDGCPAPPDRDGDGIPDSQDKCPDQAEDKDGIDDEDGCPEADADNDTVLDEKDACPKEPGPANVKEELNGCPTLTKVSEDGTVQILQPIEFDNGRATIKPGSFPILDEVVMLLRARPALRIAIHGHTDNVGTRQTNVKLSTDRAAAVRKYIEEKGIASSRLEFEGFGPDKPIESNATQDGRAKNRRVEFVILEGATSGPSEEWTE